MNKPKIFWWNFFLPKNIFLPLNYRTYRSRNSSNHHKPRMERCICLQVNLFVRRLLEHRWPSGRSFVECSLRVVNNPHIPRMLRCLNFVNWLVLQLTPSWRIFVVENIANSCLFHGKFSQQTSHRPLEYEWWCSKLLGEAVTGYIHRCHEDRWLRD